MSASATAGGEKARIALPTPVAYAGIRPPTRDGSRDAPVPCRI